MQNFVLESVEIAMKVELHEHILLLTYNLSIQELLYVYTALMVYVFVIRTFWWKLSIIATYCMYGETMP